MPVRVATVPRVLPSDGRPSDASHPHRDPKSRHGGGEERAGQPRTLYFHRLHNRGLGASVEYSHVHAAC